MKTLYHGFDGLEVAFQGCVSRGFLDTLQRAKESAQEHEKPETVTYNGLTFEVFATGASGYSFRLDTGPDGETWFIANSEKPHGWNLRVSVKSMALALYGYSAVRATIFKRLEAFRATVQAHSVGRVDFAVDVEAEGFTINPERVVCHWRSTCSQHREQSRTKAQDDEGREIEIVGQGGKVNSLTVGKMPGRQVIIYNKRREVIDRRKVHWWKIWYPDEDVSKEVTARPVWRVEIRAGKRELKDRWNVSTFDDLETLLPAILTETLEAIRLHADEQTDTNVTRQAVHELWQIAAGFAAYPFSEDDQISPAPVIAESQKAMRDKYEALVAGLAASYAVVCDIPADIAPDKIATGLVEAIRTRIMCYPGKFRDAHSRAEKRLRFMKDAATWNMAAA